MVIKDTDVFVGRQSAALGHLVQQDNLLKHCDCFVPIKTSVEGSPWRGLAMTFTDVFEMGSGKKDFLVGGYG